jgi:hypothetical protein
MQSETPSFQCTSNVPGTGWDHACVVVKRNIDTAAAVAAFEAAQTLTTKLLKPGRERLIQFKQFTSLL